ncbi:Asp-tRNA(Asn)/Glu-tRNA(Gln) amidotransferase GatCAB subunit C [Candidatus Parcubacteria bacterium]|nr:MAG: Asp-tRNA(Asn)/Glu-tRNA(Gln) amidotransferase GatCAB subunit C [Candidatus Parcubacteria bacterium]
MSSPIDKKTLEHLAELARIELKADEEEKLLRDLGDILARFEELKSLDTSRVEPMSGGTRLMGVFRDDAAGENTGAGEGKNAFPSAEDGFLKIPPVFK